MKTLPITHVRRREHRHCERGDDRPDSRNDLERARDAHSGGRRGAGGSTDPARLAMIDLPRLSENGRRKSRQASQHLDLDPADPPRYRPAAPGSGRRLPTTTKAIDQIRCSLIATFVRRLGADGPRVLFFRRPRPSRFLCHMWILLVNPHARHRIPGPQSTKFNQPNLIDARNFGVQHARGRTLTHAPGRARCLS